MRTELAKARRIIVKVGSSLLTADGTRLDAEYIRGLSAQVAEARADGREIVIVSSGAVAAGVQRLGWHARPSERANVQVAAAVGQMRLSDAYEEAFLCHGMHAGQVLLSAEDMAHRTLYLNARTALRRMLDCGVAPVVNENDVIATDAVHFGDNDRLAAQMANLLEADALLMFTDADGLRAHGGLGDTIRQAAAGDDSLLNHIAAGSSATGSGGMAAKLRAAQIAARSGAHSLIADGRKERFLLRALSGDESFGTLLTADVPRLSARKQWLASGLHLRGRLCLDAGAVQAVVKAKKSLLPAGVCQVQGDFIRGDAVALEDNHRRVIGYALVNYDAAAARRLCGVNSRDIAATLGYAHEDEMAHRDNMSIL